MRMHVRIFHLILQTIIMKCGYFIWYFSLFKMLLY